MVSVKSTSPLAILLTLVLTLGMLFGAIALRAAHVPGRFVVKSEDLLETPNDGTFRVTVIQDTFTFQCRAVIRPMSAANANESWAVPCEKGK